MVTRTVKKTDVCVLGLDITSQSARTEVIPVTGEIEDDFELALKMAKKANKDPNFIPCKVESTFVQEELRGMPEWKFIELSEVLPPRFANKEEGEE